MDKRSELIQRLLLESERRPLITWQLLWPAMVGWAIGIVVSVTAILLIEWMVG